MWIFQGNGFIIEFKFYYKDLDIMKKIGLLSSGGDCSGMNVAIRTLTNKLGQNAVDLILRSKSGLDTCLVGMSIFRIHLMKS